jgi:glycosyltransferase involved in cell wall biosynthesis
VIHQTNAGVAAAWNTGLDAAKGDFIGFVDSDDWISPDMYESMMNNLVEANADIAYTSAVFAYEDGSFSTKRTVQNVHMVMSNAEAFKYINLPGYFYITVWGQLIKRSVVGNLRIQPHGREGGDLRFSYNVLARAETVVYDSTPKYYYRIRGDSNTQSKMKVDFSTLDQSAEMVEMVKNRFPEQLPYALYSHLIHMIGIYDTATKSGLNEAKDVAALRQRIQDFSQKNLATILSSYFPSKRRLFQIRLLSFSPLLYGWSVRIFAKIPSSVVNKMIPRRKSVS